MLYGFILVMLYGCFLPHLNILKNSKKSILIKKYLHKILVKWLTLVLRTTCRFTFADTNILLQGCIRHFEPDSHAPIGGEIFLLLLHTLMCSLTIFQLYAFFFWEGGGGLGPYFSVKGLDCCLSSILSCTNKYQEPPLEQNLSLPWLVFLRPTLKQNFS